MVVNFIMVPRKQILLLILGEWMYLCIIACFCYGIFAILATLLSLINIYIIIRVGVIWRRYYKVFWYLITISIGVLPASLVRLAIFRTILIWR